MPPNARPRLFAQIAPEWKPAHAESHRAVNPSFEEVFPLEREDTQLITKNALLPRPNASTNVPQLMRTVEISRTALTSSLWDSFAHKCGASFQSGYHAIRACGYDAFRKWQKNLLPLRLRLFEIYDKESDHKIGQCAIALRGQHGLFIDGLQLLPERHGSWTTAMAALLARLGPGRYRYGSHWNIEPPRERNLETISGLAIEAVEPLTLQAVDFSRWKSWDDYLHGVSKNARRNANRACAGSPSLRIRRGLATVIDIPALVRLEACTLRRKNLKPASGRNFARLVRAITMPEYLVTAAVSSYGRHVACFYGIEFGHNVYYLEGGSQPDNHGAAWYLMLEMIRQAYDRSRGTGKFLMGTTQDGRPGWAGLARSREQCRVTDFPTSVVTFSCCRSIGLCN
jgi:GNAT acetyltransferase-like protein